MKSNPPTNASALSAELLIETPTEVGDDQIEFAAQITEDSHVRQRIWFRFPRSYGSQLTRRADPFVIVTAVHALRRYRKVHVRGTVSEGLFANLAEFQAAFAAFHHLPHFEPVEYSATDLAPPAGAAHRASGITAFSGGVDSCFSVFRHTALSSMTPKRAIGAALMMHGFDIPLTEPGTFSQSVARSKRLTDDAGVRLFTGVTNLRILPVRWEETFAAAVAGSLAFFQPAFSFGLVPSCQQWSQARFDNGSNPLTDPLLSSASFQIIHDGTFYGRIDKLRRLAAWPAAMRNMRVCWQGAELDRNCGVCEKCVRTLLMLDVCGVTDVGAFPGPPALDALSNLVIKSQGGLDEMDYLLKEARALGLQRPWMKPVARMLSRNRRNRILWRQGQSIAELVPTPVRSALRTAGHRWLWNTPHAQQPPTISPAAAPVGSR